MPPTWASSLGWGLEPGARVSRSGASPTIRTTIKGDLSMQPTEDLRSPILRPRPNRSDAQRMGLIDGKEWAEKWAHPSELSRIGFEYEVNKRLGYNTAFRFRGRRPGEELFLQLIKPDLDEAELRDA